MSIGIQSAFLLPADQAITSSTTLVNATNISFAVAAGKQARCRFSFPFNLAGTASGAKFQITPSASPTKYLLAWKLFSGASTGSLAAFADQTTSAAFSNALAAAANHYMEADLYIQANTACTVTLQIAQLVSDSGAMTLLQGGSAVVIIF